MIGAPAAFDHRIRVRGFESLAPSEAISRAQYPFLGT